MDSPAPFRAALRRRLLDALGTALLAGPGARDAGAADGWAAFPPPSTPTQDELIELATTAARDGCVRDTVDAVLAAEAVARAPSRDDRAALEAHAAARADAALLAWHTVAWALDIGGDEVHWAVVRVLRDAARYAPEADDVLAPARALDEVVRPCAARLLGHAAARAAALDPRRRTSRAA